ncbi:uncharacterized protein SPSK_10823 [Sporothrix schenckii 1099-18]|uniref:Uncharacterized protein n=1 Tax=Sporothrix schenckii 1099-18 TaxID=1397361 RepID=A0A0F2MFN4_SPOSC|nr:uncharacterized protein SPSK_10823 [Sporothrix schenckii 1099-18]KJR88503.1 hypothetical protein SPSK_10823 [Sporothrix schenckii 1099-18]
MASQIWVSRFGRGAGFRRTDSQNYTASGPLQKSGFRCRFALTQATECGGYVMQHKQQILHPAQRAVARKRPAEALRGGQHVFGWMSLAG